MSKRNEKMKEKINEFINIKFDPKTAIAVREPLLNSYGFDLTNENAIGYSTDKLQFTILGFKPIEPYSKLMVTLKVTHRPHIQDEFVYIDTFDLYIPERIELYTRKAAQQLSVNQDAVKRPVFQLRDRLEKYRLDELKNGQKENKQISITEKERREALNYLKADNLVESIEGLLKESGLVTEVKNGLTLFLILQTRHLKQPLHALLQGSAQLSRMLMDSVASTMPPQQIHVQTSMSASPIYYTVNKNYWKNKVLYLTNIDKQFKGASTIKEFIDNLKLSRYTTESDYKTRQLYSVNKEVEGPICLLGFSEDDSINNKFFQECFFIRVEENEKNRKEVLEYLKNESCGFIDAEEQEKAKRLLMVIQELVEPKKVVIPYAGKLAPSGLELQPIQSFKQLLTFIKAVALIHQHQLKTKKDLNGEEYIEATPYHLEIALEHFKSISLSQSDLLSPRLRSLLESIKTELKSKEDGFKSSQMMKELKIKRSPFYRDLNLLIESGYVRKKGGDKKHGIEYVVVDWDEYKVLQDNMNHFEEQLKRIKEESLKFPTKYPKVKSLINKAS